MPNASQEPPRANALHPARCGTCEGRGRLSPEESPEIACPTCAGQGQVWNHVDTGPRGPDPS